MRGRSASWWVIGGLVTAACVEVPAHQPCPADDLDCDGWPSTGVNSAALDCDDRDPAVHPGAREDNGTAIDDDCIGGALRDPIEGVTGGALAWSSGDLDIEFGSASGMPSSLQIDRVETLARQASPCPVFQEEGMGISLYPAFAAHVRTMTPTGDPQAERVGPAAGTSLVAWTMPLPARAVTPPPAPSCNVATSVAANVRFTVLPRGRLIREDVLNLENGVATCSGCAGNDAMPIFASYLTLAASFDRIRIDAGPELAFDTAVGMTPTLGPGVHRVCIRQSTGRGHFALTWQDTGLGVRIRSTGGADSHALVFDWLRGSMPAAAGRYAVTSALVADDDSAADCSADAQGMLGEIIQPPLLEGLDYRRERGMYEPAVVAPGALEFVARTTVAHGIAVRTAGLGARGITVWRRSDGGPLSRLTRDEHYLVQLDPDGATVVYLPTLAMGDRITLAGPRQEPAP